METEKMAANTKVENKRFPTLRRQWPLLLVAIALVITSTLLWRSLLNATPPPSAATDSGIPNYKEEVLDPLSKDPRVRETSRQARLEKAKRLREHWRGWAEKHQDILRQMAHARPDDQVTMARAWEELPALPGMKHEDSGISAKELNESGKRYTWDIDNSKFRVKPSSDPEWQTRIKQQHSFLKDRARQDFAQYRDFRISGSMNAGPSQLTLWASGRITETTTLEYTNPAPGTPIFYDSPPKELVAAFDFVRK